MGKDKVSSTSSSSSSSSKNRKEKSKNKSTRGVMKGLIREDDEILRSTKKANGGLTTDTNKGFGLKKNM